MVSHKFCFVLVQHLITHDSYIFCLSSLIMSGYNSKTNYSAMSNRQERRSSRRSSDGSSQASSSSRGRVSVLNILNGIAYAINVIVTFGVGVGGIGGFPTNEELSEKYQTLITPAGWAFSIWSIIFTFQFIFIVCQFTSKYSNAPLVVKGVSYWYIFTCLTQAG